MRMICDICDKEILDNRCYHFADMTLHDSCVKAAIQSLVKIRREEKQLRLKFKEEEEK